MGESIGTLEAGKSADLAAFALDALGPLQDPVTAAVYSITGARARFVAVGGRPLYRGGVLTNATMALATRVQKSADALRDWLAEGGELTS